MPILTLRRTSFRSILSIIGLLLLTFTVYALLTVEILGLTKLGNATDTYANFRNFGRAMLTLFRMTTGEKWNVIYSDMTIESHMCTTNTYSYLLTDCGSPSFAGIMLISFEFFVTLMLMSLL